MRREGIRALDVGRPRGRQKAVRSKVRTETGRCNRGCNGLGPVITVRRLTRRLPAERWLPAMRLPRWLTAKVQVRKAEVRKEVRT